jgi:hypothetical protein
MLRLLTAVAAAAVASGLQARDKDTLRIVQAECVARCDHIGPLPAPAGTCEAYRNAKPYPQVWRVCEDTYRAGGIHGCELGCSEDTICMGLASSTAIIKGRDRACGAYDNMLPRPAMGQSCRLGFTRGAEPKCAESHAWLTEQYNARAAQAATARAVSDAARAADAEAAAAARAAQNAAARQAREAAKAAARGRAAAAAADAAATDAARAAAEEERMRGKTRGMDGADAGGDAGGDAPAA